MPSVKKKNLVRRDAFSCYDGCRAVMPNGHFTLYCSMFDVQWVSGSQAEWSSLFYIVQCLVFSGCRVVTEEKFDVQCVMPSQSPLLLLY